LTITTASDQLKKPLKTAPIKAAGEKLPDHLITPDFPPERAVYREKLSGKSAPGCKKAISTPLRFYLKL
jgi:hypothetical protein